MPKPIAPLTKAEFEKAITGLDQKLAVGNGLYYHRRGGSALWVYQWREGADSFRALSLGSYPELSLYAARQAREARAVARRSGRIERRGLRIINTAEPASEPKTASPKRMRFAAVLEEFITINAPSWKASNRDKGMRDYRKLSGTSLGTLWVDAITSTDIEQALKKQWPDAIAYMHKARMQVQLVISFAVAKRYRPNGENPASAEIMNHLLPKLPKVKHHKAMPASEIPALFAELVADGSPHARALAFCILTMTRTGETQKADWSEIEGNVWTIPGGIDGRMKEGEIHRVWLSPAALALLGKPKKAGRVFPGIGHSALIEKLGELRPGKDYTTHGMRTAFKGDWALKAGYPAELRDMALSHKAGDAVAQAYSLPASEVYTVLIPMSQAWSDYISR